MTNSKIRRLALEYQTHPRVNPSRLIMAIVWSAFLMAAVSCGLLFTMIDPLDLIIFGEKFSLSSQAGYTLGFIIFWLLGCVASTITVVLLVKPR